MRKSSLIILITLAISCVSTLGLYIPPASAIIWIEGHITSDTTWSSVDTYRVINDTYVDSGVTLTILSGVHVQLADGFSLIVQGNLNATGTDTNPIVFTSSRVSPSAGAWNTIDFSGPSNSSFMLEHIRVEYAVNGITVESQGYATIAVSELSNCSQSAIMIKGESNLVIDENTIRYNNNGIESDSSILDGIVIAGNTISSNVQNGIDLTSSSIYNVTFSSNTVSSNTQNGIYLDAGNSLYNVTFSSNTVSSNTQNGIYLSTRSQYASIYNVSAISNNVSSNGGNGIYFYTDGYAPMMFYGTGSIYNVYMSSNIILSNSENGIYLYSYGRAPNGDIHDISLSSNVASMNGGNGIQMYAYGYETLSGNGHGFVYNVSLSSNVASMNGGNGIYLGGYINGHIYNVSMSSNTASSNQQNGVYLEASTHMNGLEQDVVMSTNLISSNHQKGIWIKGAVNGNLTHNSLSYNQYGIFYSTTQNNRAGYNDIYTNDYGMNVTEGATVNAEYNHWGKSSGPYQSSLNPEGKGNPVNGNGVDLDFIPFLTSPQGYINQRPVAALSVDKHTVNINETVTLDATDSTDDGRIDYYFFDFGDGINSSWITLPAVTHKYALNETYYATVTVMDDYGVTSTNAQLIKVQIIVVPEFPSFLILPLFTIATLLAVIVHRKKHGADTEFS